MSEQLKGTRRIRPIEVSEVLRIDLCEQSDQTPLNSGYITDEILNLWRQLLVMWATNPSPQSGQRSRQRIRIVRTRLNAK